MRSNVSASFLALALISTSLLSGCSLWRPKHPELKAAGIAASTAATYRERWVAQRTAALVAIGTPAASAPAQAQADFDKQFPGLLTK